MSLAAVSADLAVAKTVSDSTPDVGDTITFTVTLTNNGPNSATNVHLTDALPAGLGFVSATPSQGSYASSSGVWTVGTLAAGTSATLSLMAQVAATGGLTNTATVTDSDQPDPDPSNNSGSSTVTRGGSGLAGTGFSGAGIITAGLLLVLAGTGLVVMVAWHRRRSAGLTS